MKRRTLFVLAAFLGVVALPWGVSSPALAVPQSDVNVVQTATGIRIEVRNVSTAGETFSGLSAQLAGGYSATGCSPSGSCSAGGDAALFDFEPPLATGEMANLDVATSPAPYDGTVTLKVFVTGGGILEYKDLPVSQATTPPPPVKPPCGVVVKQTGSSLHYEIEGFETPDAKFTYFTKVGDKVQLSFSASGGAPPYVFQLAPSSKLPHGLSLDPGTGVISGHATEAGASFSAMVIATDSQGCSASVATAPFDVDLYTQYTGTFRNGKGEAELNEKVKRACSFFLDLSGAVPAEPRRQLLRPANGTLGDVGTMKGKVQAGTKGPLSVKLTKAAIRALEKKHKLRLWAHGLRRQGSTKSPVAGPLVIRLPRR